MVVSTVYSLTPQCLTGSQVGPARRPGPTGPPDDSRENVPAIPNRNSGIHTFMRTWVPFPSLALQPIAPPMVKRSHLQLAYPVALTMLKHHTVCDRTIERSTVRRTGQLPVARCWSASGANRRGLCTRHNLAFVCTVIDLTRHANIASHAFMCGRRADSRLRGETRLHRAP